MNLQELATYDYKIGGSFGVFPAATTSKLAIPGDPDRISICFIPDFNNWVSWLTDTPAVAGALNYLILAPKINPFILRRQEFGDLVTKPWYVFAQTAITVQWIEGRIMR